MTHYLVDYENISDAELQDIGEIPEESCVHIFYSANKAKISLDSLSAIDMATLKTIKVNPGKQALDMQLVSYLGSLIGMDKARKDDYFIVSKDRDYECVVKFWKSYRKVDIRVINFKKESPAKRKGTATSEAKPAGKATTSSEAKSSTGKTASTLEAKPIHKVASNPADANIQNDAVAEGQGNGKSETRTDAKPETKIEHKVTDEELLFVEELIKEHKGDNSQRQKVYIGIIGKYGQKKGLAIYKQLKGRIK